MGFVNIPGSVEILSFKCKQKKLTVIIDILVNQQSHAQAGVMWSGLVSIYIYIYIYICLWTKKIFESYFNDQLTFSNIRNRTSCRIYRLALPLRAPEMLSSLSKSRISIFNAHLTLFVRRMTSHNSISMYRHLVNWLGTCLGTERRHWQTRQVESLQEVNVVNWLGTCYGIITRGPVGIVIKLYQFHIVTVIELRSVSLTTLSFVLWLIVVSTANSYLLLSVLFTSHLNKDKQDCRTFQIVNQFHSWRNLKWGLCNL